jgi:hypothetical protein
LEGYTDIRTGLPSDAALSHHTACVQGKVEFGRKVRGASKLQTRTVIAQIADGTTDRRAPGQNDLGAFEYINPRKLPTLKHGQHSELQSWQTNFRPNLFHNRKRDRFQSPNL